MKPASFGYSRPRAVAEALGALAAFGPDAKVLAGGQSLIPLMSMRLAAPRHLVDINRLEDLAYVRVAGGRVAVGALARHSDVLRDQPAADAQPLLAAALRLVAHPTIRNRGTTVGSIVHADPAAEMAAVLALLAGSVRLASVGGERTVPARDFFLGPLESDVRPGELATEASFPVLAPGEGTAFAEVSRRYGDYAVCGAAALVRLGKHGEISRASAAYLSVAPRPLVLDLTEALAGHDARPGRSGGLRDAVTAAAREARERIDPEPDIHASAEYRRQLAGVLTERVLRDAIAQARERGLG